MSDEAQRAPGTPTETLYSVQVVARLTGAPVDQLRRWARSGLLPPRRSEGNTHFYEFADVIAARTAMGLLDRGIRTRQVREAVEAVRAWRPDVTQPLASLRVLDDHGHLIVRMDETLLDPRSGQAVLALPMGPLAEAASAVGQVLEVVQAPPAPEPINARDWVRRGLEAENDEDLDSARSRYLRALELEPEHPGALLNLGNLTYARGELRAACELYRAATRADPTYPEAWYNLANTLDDLHHYDAAVHAYEVALKLAPDFADAHFNLGLCWEKQGQRARARPHWARFLELDPQGESSSIARDFLDSADGG
jgi:tetratricopeptide (TPR) repeat protein